MKRKIILDMDGTMFDTEPLWEKAFIKTGKELGYNFTIELHNKTIGSNEDYLKEILTKEMGKDFPFDTFMKNYLVNMDTIVYEDGIGIKEGLLELLDYLINNNYDIAIASSSSIKNIKRNLKVSNIDENIFKVVVSGEDFSKGKPNPEIFIKTCELLNSNPNETIVIEDSNNGIKSAYNAGCIPILIPDLDQITNETKEMSKYQFKSLKEVINLLETKK